MVLGHVCVAVAVQVIGGQSHLPGDGCDEHVELAIFFAGEGLCKNGIGGIQLVMGEQLICLLVGIFDCSTVRSVIMAPV